MSFHPIVTPTPDNDNTPSANDSVLAMHSLERNADLELRLAWLTVHAERMYEVDPGGQISAALLDLRDLLSARHYQGKAAA